MTLLTNAFHLTSAVIVHFNFLSKIAC